jgi:hypothetical protein
VHKEIGVNAGSDRNFGNLPASLIFKCVLYHPAFINNILGSYIADFFLACIRRIPDYAIKPAGVLNLSLF